MTDGLLAVWDQWAQDRLPAERTLTGAAFRALADGWTPTVAALAPGTAETQDTLTRTLQAMVAQGLATVDGEYITGIGGLSLVPAPHRLQWNGRQYWTWCALDAIGIPAAFGGSATVISRIAPAGDAITVAFADGAWQRPDPMLGIRLAEPAVGRPLCADT